MSMPFGRDNIPEQMDELVEKFGEDFVIGYICCSVWTFIKSAKESNEKGNDELKNFFCDLIIIYISEYERITGESVVTEDVIAELDWWPSRENQPL